MRRTRARTGQSPVVAALLLWLVAAPAAAQTVYRCQGPDGVVFSQSPCAPDAERVEIDVPGDRSTPARRLIGQWSTSANDQLYFGRVGADGTGPYTLVQGSGRTFEHRYRVIDEDTAAWRLVVELLFVNGGSRRETFVFDPDDSEHAVSRTVVTGYPIASDLRYRGRRTQP